MTGFIRLLAIIRLRVLSLLSRDQVEQELDEELRYHLERQIEQEMATGKTYDDARYAALRVMGSLEPRKEECRDMRKVNVIDNLLKDLRHALRMMRRCPGSTLVTILILALGIGSVTTVFSVVDTTLLRPLPYSDAGRIMAVARTAPRYDHPVPVSGADFLDWRARNHVFSGMAAYNFTNVTRTGAAAPEQVPAGQVSASFFSVLGMRAELGRGFGPGDDQPGKNYVVVLSHYLWQKWFGGSRSASDLTLLWMARATRSSELCLLASTLKTCATRDFGRRLSLSPEFNAAGTGYERSDGLRQALV